MPNVYVNGAFLPSEQASVSVMDRAYLFADGVYEVIPVYRGKPFHPDRHMARLSRSLAAVDIPEPLDAAAWSAVFERLIEEHAREHGNDDLSLYLQVTRGAGVTRNHGGSADLQPSVTAFTLTTAPVPPPESESGIAAVTLEDIRWGRCDIKSTALLPNVLATQQAQVRGAEEAILIRDGRLTEGASSNIFVVREGRVRTPPTSHAILAGITREVVIELLRSVSIPIEEVDVPASDLDRAEEIWRSNSTREVAPITQLNGSPVGDGRPGPLWLRIRALFDAYKERL